MTPARAAMTLDEIKSYLHQDLGPELERYKKNDVTQIHRVSMYLLALQEVFNEHGLGDEFKLNMEDPLGPFHVTLGTLCLHIENSRSEGRPGIRITQRLKHNTAAEVWTYYQREEPPLNQCPILYRLCSTVSLFLGDQPG